MTGRLLPTGTCWCGCGVPGVDGLETTNTAAYKETTLYPIIVSGGCAGATLGPVTMR